MCCFFQWFFPPFFSKTSMMHPFKIENYSLASWVKAHCGGSKLQRCEGVGVHFFESEVSDFVNFVYLIDDKSSVKHFDVLTIANIQKTLQIAIEKAVDHNEALLDNDSDESSSSSSDSDSDGENNDTGQHVGEFTKSVNSSDIREDQFIINMFKLKKFLDAKRAVRAVKKEFEQQCIKCIKEYDEHQRSKLRAKLRLHVFVDEQNWYQQGSKYSIKPSQGASSFHRPFQLCNNSENNVNNQHQQPPHKTCNTQRDLPD